MAKKVKPLGKRVLVKRIDEDDKSEGGIIIPDSAKEKPQEAKVISLGQGQDKKGKNYKFNVKIGDVVLISKYGGTDIKVGGEDMLIISEDDILGVIA